MRSLLLEDLQHGSARHQLETPRDYINLLIRVTPERWKFFIILDGLDNCSRQAIATLFRELKYLSESRVVSVLFSSRTWRECPQAVTAVWDPASTIVMEDADRSDEINSYITLKLTQYANLGPDSREILQAALQELWDGMFLWLSLQIELVLDDIDRDAPIRDIVESLPTELHETYDRALLRISEDNQTHAVRIMKLVAAADPALSLIELRVAGTITPENEVADDVSLPDHAPAFLRYYGAHLLTIDEDEKVCFIHHSALRHVLDPALVESGAHQLHFTLPDAQSHLAAVCVTYLNLLVMSRHLVRQERRGKSSGINIPERITQTIVTHGTASNSRLQGVYKAAKLRGIVNGDESRRVDRLFSQWIKRPVADVNEIEALLPYSRQHWLGMTRYIDLQSPELLRCWEEVWDGRTRAVSCPLDHSSPDPDQRPFQWAVSHGHHCLFEFSCLSTKLFDSTLDTPFLADILLDRIMSGSLPGVVGPCLFPMVIKSIESKSLKSLERRQVQNLGKLLFPSATSERRQRLSSTTISRLETSAPTFLVILIGLTYDWRDVAVDLILKLKPMVDLDLPLLDGQTAAELAFFYNRDWLVPHLQTASFQSLEIGQRDQEDTESSLPLVQAARMGHADGVRLLLESGAQLNLQDHTGKTALEWASHYGHFECVFLLLDHADTHDCQPAETDAYLFASGGLHVNCVYLLVRKGTNVKFRDDRGNTALHYAVENASGTSSRELLEVLLRDVYSRYLDDQNNLGNTALHVACGKADISTVAELLNAGAQLDLKNAEDHTPRDVVEQKLEELKYSTSTKARTDFVEILELLNAKQDAEWGRTTLARGS